MYIFGILMSDNFKTYLQANTGLDDAGITQMMLFAVSRKLQKNEFVLHEGDVCRQKIFVVSGLLRAFNMTMDGSEHIVRFSQENSWIIDKESYDRQVPARTSISAVEPSHILTWNKADFEKLNQELPALKQFTTQITADNIYLNSQRLLTTLSATPEEKYQDFIQNNPGLLLRVPLKMIAAYLGVSLRTLDRIRHAQLQQP